MPSAVSLPPCAPVDPLREMVAAVLTPVKSPPPTCSSSSASPSPSSGSHSTAVPTDLDERAMLAIAVWWTILMAFVLGLWPAARPPRAALLAGGFLAALGVVTAASIAWAASAERAFAEANRIALFAGRLRRRGARGDARNAPAGSPTGSRSRSQRSGCWRCRAGSSPTSSRRASAGVPAQRLHAPQLAGRVLERARDPRRARVPAALPHRDRGLGERRRAQPCRRGHPRAHGHALPHLVARGIRDRAPRRPLLLAPHAAAARHRSRPRARGRGLGRGRRGAAGARRGGGRSVRLGRDRPGTQRRGAPAARLRGDRRDVRARRSLPRGPRPCSRASPASSRRSCSSWSRSPASWRPTRSTGSSGSARCPGPRSPREARRTASSGRTS